MTWSLFSQQSTCWDSQMVTETKRWIDQERLITPFLPHFNNLKPKKDPCTWLAFCFQLRATILSLWLISVLGSDVSLSDFEGSGTFTEVLLCYIHTWKFLWGGVDSWERTPAGALWSAHPCTRAKMNKAKWRKWKLGFICDLADTDWTQ